MGSDLVTGLAAVALGLLLVALVGLVWLGVVLAWGQRRTRGLAYFGLPPAERDRFRRRLRFHRRALSPLLSVLARASPFTFERASFRHEGVAAPLGTCTPESFRAGTEHEATANELYVVTQMRSGTTWMQHLVYQILTRGSGDLVGEGRTLYAVSPWLEAEIGVELADAPPICEHGLPGDRRTHGEERPSRIVKTHLPVELCPFSSAARYVYVARHPASCFASCADFLRGLGPLAPSLDRIEAWFCSHEGMWWGSWPRHVHGWWRRAEEVPNVLFVTFEEMVADSGGVIERITEFLGMRPLEPEQKRRVDEKTRFDYMRRHKGTFEMYPPHLLAVDSDYFSRGTADRHRDVPQATRERVTAWCREQAAASGGFPWDGLFPTSCQDVELPR